MNYEEAAEQIARRPAVHRLCYGAFLQAPVWISPDVLAVPLASLSFEAEFRYVAIYLRQFFGIDLAPEEIQAGRLQGAEALPVITLIHFAKVESPTMRAQADRTATGIAQKTVTLTALKKFDFPAPSLKQQLEFRSQVGSIDRMRRITMAAAQEQETLFASLQHRAFRGEL